MAVRSLRSPDNRVKVTAVTMVLAPCDGYWRVLDGGFQYYNPAKDVRVVKLSSKSGRCWKLEKKRVCLLLLAT